MEQLNRGAMEGRGLDCTVYLQKDGTWTQYGKKAALWEQHSDLCYVLLGNIGKHFDFYWNAVANHIHPSMTEMFPDGGHLFLQDNGSCHSEEQVQEDFKEPKSKIPIRLIHSKDFNLQDELIKHIKYMKVHLKTSNI